MSYNLNNALTDTEYFTDIDTEISIEEESLIENSVIDEIQEVNILSSSRKKMREYSPNQEEDEIFFIQKLGKVEYAPNLHTTEPYNLDQWHFNSIDEGLEWCKTIIECDGVSFNPPTNEIITWSTDSNNHFSHFYEWVSWFKSSSIRDDCLDYNSQLLFKPKTIDASKHNIPLVSNTVIVESQKIEFLKGQAGAIKYDGLDAENKS